VFCVTRDGSPFPFDLNTFPRSQPFLMKIVFRSVFVFCATGAAVPSCPWCFRNRAQRSRRNRGCPKTGVCVAAEAFSIPCQCELAHFGGSKPGLS